MIENQGENLSAKGEDFSGEVKCELIPTEEQVSHAEILGKQKNRCKGSEWDQPWFEVWRGHQVTKMCREGGDKGREMGRVISCRPLKVKWGIDSILRVFGGLQATEKHDLTYIFKRTSSCVQHEAVTILGARRLIRRLFQQFRWGLVVMFVWNQALILASGRRKGKDSTGDHILHMFYFTDSKYLEKKLNRYIRESPSPKEGRAHLLPGSPSL